MATTRKTKPPVAKKNAVKTSAKKIEAAVNEAIEEVTEEVTEQATSAVKSLNTNASKVQNVAKQVWFANLGLYGRTIEEVQNRYVRANEELQSRYSQLNEDRQNLVEDLVVRGEKVQDQAEVLLQEGRASIEEQIEIAKNRLTDFVSVVDIPARLQNVSDKLQALSKDLKKTA